MAMTASTSSARSLRALVMPRALLLSTPTLRPALPENLRIRPPHILGVQCERIRQAPLECPLSPDFANRRRKHFRTHFHGFASLRALSPSFLRSQLFRIHGNPAHGLVPGPLIHPLQELGRCRNHLRFHWPQRRAFLPIQSSVHLIPMPLHERRHVLAVTYGLPSHCFKSGYTPNALPIRLGPRLHGGQGNPYPRK